MAKPAFCPPLPAHQWFFPFPFYNGIQGLWLAQSEYRRVEKAVWKVSSEKQTKKTAMHSCRSMASTEDWDTCNHFSSSSLNLPDVFSLLCQTSLYSLH